MFFSSSDREFVTYQKNKKEMLKGRQLLISGGKKVGKKENLIVRRYIAQQWTKEIVLNNIT